MKIVLQCTFFEVLPLRLHIFLSKCPQTSHLGLKILRVLLLRVVGYEMSWPYHTTIKKLKPFPSSN